MHVYGAWEEPEDLARTYPDTGRTCKCHTGKHLAPRRFQHMTFLL